MEKIGPSSSAKSRAPASVNRRLMVFSGIVSGVSNFSREDYRVRL
jgi:hypothetical protein